MVDYTESGVLTTASDLLFSGGREGHFFALDARTGELLWSVNLGGTIASGPITFAVDGSSTWRCAGTVRSMFSGCSSRRVSREGARRLVASG